MSWYKNADDPVAISTRIRLARNLSGIPFTSRMSEAQARDVESKVIDAVKNSNTVFADTIRVIDMEKLSDAEALSLAERHLISPEFAGNRRGRKLLLSEDECISIMLCEEDHIRIQVLSGGLEVAKTLDLADKLDTVISERLDIAFDRDLGYLSECPTNLGTGLRASVMLHLPAIEMTGEINSIFEAVTKVGLTVRGMYGEGSGATASLYQVSNQITLGISERAAAENLELIVKSIIAKETEARKRVMSVQLEDEICRAYGTLRYARLVSGSELMKLLSMVRLGISAGVIENTDLKPLTALMIESKPATLTLATGAKTAEERDKLRAEKIRKALE